MADKKPSKKKRFQKILAVSSVIISLILSSMAYFNTSEIDEKSGEDGDYSITRMGPIYGTHSCEKGGFSIQIGIDSDHNQILDNDEVSEIRNVCHGNQGESGPMGNRGYWGYNGTDGLDGSNGTDGIDGIVGESAFIDSKVGEYGSCPEAVVIEMGNNISSKEVDSSIKICFQDLTSGMMTDIQPNSGNSFSTPCEGGFSNGELFVFAAFKTDKCLLFKMENYAAEQISPTVDFSPGAILGFIEHNNRIWFDATDELGTQLWSTDGETTWKETNLSGGINSNDDLLKHGDELILNHQGGIAIFAESEMMISGDYDNISSVNGILIYNTQDNISIDGNIHYGELNSLAVFVNGHYWFIATSDIFGPQLHRSNGQNLEQITNHLQSDTGLHIPPVVVGDRILFNSGGLFSYDPVNSSLSELNSSLQNVGEGVDAVNHDGMLWFDCGIPEYGFELCASNGYDAWLHSDFATGISSSNPSHLALIGDNLLTLVNDPIEGGQLHLVSVDGLQLLWDHDSGDMEAGVHGDLWITQDMVYYIADSTTHGLEMFGWSHGELTDEWIIIN